MKKMVYLSLVVGLFVMRSDAFIYQATVLRRWDAMQQRYQWFIGLGDYHNKKHPINEQHKQQLFDLLAVANPGSTKVLTEDLSVPNIEGRFSCGKFYVNSRGGILGGLTECCHDLGLEVENLEYRYCRVCALGPVLNDPHADPFTHPSVAGISVQEMCDEVYHTCDRISTFDDGPLLNAWYQERVNGVKQKVQRLGWQRYGFESVADMLVSQAKPQNRHEAVKTLLTFDSSLFDAELVHAVANTPHERICAIAGGSHIERASAMLERVGFQKVMEEKPFYHKENDPQQCIGSEMRQGGYCLQPQPIQLQTVSKYF